MSGNKKETTGNKKDAENKPGEKIQDDITLTTEDSKSIAGYIWFLKEKKSEKQPLVILIHQFKQSKEQWSNEFVDSLLNTGYKVLAYDIRGHGGSSKVNYDLTRLLTDPDEAPKDLKSIVAWAKKIQGIDSTRIACIGTSIGGNLACYGKMFLGVKTAIAISNSKETFFKFMGIDERMMGRIVPAISSVFYICGSKDGNHEQEEKELLDSYTTEPKDMKVFDSDKHGKFLIEEKPEIYSLMLTWLKKNL